MAFTFERVRTAEGWVDDVSAAKNTDAAVITNDHIVEKCVLRVLVARWVIFKFFIETAKAMDPEGRLPEDIKLRWLLFQLENPLPAGILHPLEFLSSIALAGVTRIALENFVLVQNPAKIVGETYDTDRFMLAFDEAQTAATLFVDAPTDATARGRRPALRPIVNTLCRFTNALCIVSGTGFPIGAFEEHPGSNIAKGPASRWDKMYATGDFLDLETQKQYISRYLPPDFLSSTSGEALVQRTYKWLRGR